MFLQSLAFSIYAAAWQSLQLLLGFAVLRPVLAIGSFCAKLRTFSLAVLVYGFKSPSDNSLAWVARLSQDP